MKNDLKHFAIGAAMGASDIIPGVSGGTIAFILGIYQKLVDGIKKSGDAIPLILKRDFTQAFAQIPFRFFIGLGSGILLSVVIMSKLIEQLLLDHPLFVWSFFFGLVLASGGVIGYGIKKWGVMEVMVVFVSALLSFFMVGLPVVSLPDSLPFIFLSGAIAICAMILPGISGSFILVILDKYDTILSAVNNRDLVVILVFMFGAGIGILTFARVVSWLFRHYKRVTTLTLVGIMVGSLRKVWPWKEMFESGVGSYGKEINVFPPVDRNLLMPIFCCLLGAVIILLVTYVQKKYEYKKR